MKRTRRKSSPLRLAGASAVLIAGGWFCIANVLAELGGPGNLSTGPASDVAALPDETAGATDDETQGGPGGVGDLLGRVGSYRPDQPVPAAFALPDAAAAELPPAAPAGEQQAPAGPWAGATPPELLVTFVMVGGDLSRACVDGRIVGIGDRVAGGVVRAIQRDGIEVQGAARRLFYELQERLPREYRAAMKGRTADPSNEQESK